MVFSNNLLLGATGAAGGYTIDQSIRFNSADSSYLSRTPSSDPTGGDASGAKQFTVSVWLKRGKLSVAQAVFAADASVNSAMAVQFAGASGSTLADQIDFDQESGGSPRDRMIPSALYRDVSAWYHLCLMVDTTQATAANRLKIAINGVLVSDWYTNDPPALNAYFQWNKNSVIQRIGSNSHNVGNLFDGYMAEFHNVDGVAAETSFGEFNNDGVWVPKAYTGTYGTNGFYITGEDSAALGTDYSGNGNDFTSSGLTTDDQVTDTPTNYGTDTGAGGEVSGNYCTMNPVASDNTGGVFSDGNLVSSSSSLTYVTATWCGTVGAAGVIGGKWYYEIFVNTAAPAPYNLGAYPSIFMNGTAINATNVVNSDLVGVAVDLDAGKLWWRKNGGAWVGGGDPATGATPSGSFTAGSGFSLTVRHSSSVGDKLTWNFGQRPYADAAPSGFKALCTQNIPAPAIKDGSKYFQTTLYTGNGTAIGSGGNAVTQIGNSTFQPDFVWIKGRSGATSHLLFDAVRGATKYLSSDGTYVENTGVQSLSTFDTDGFTLGNQAGVNTNAATYAAWQWKANGAGVSNTDGTISSTVSVNQTAGFSVVTATAGASGVYSYGHGLGVKPSMFIVKNLDAAQNWQIWNKNLTSETTSYLQFTTSAQLTFADMWGAAPTSTTFSMHTSGPVVAGDNFVAYCFAEVEGFSKFGKYTGNGAADGAFIYTGFKPAFVLVKRTNSTSQWSIFDNKREGYNVDNDVLVPNTTATETTTDYLDLLSNGFKARTTDANVNASGGTYIFMAFAENPFGGDGVAPATAR